MGDTYTHGHHASVLRSHTWRTAENSAAHLLPHLRSGQRLLDVGCGPATITVDLARVVMPGPVLGIDRSTDVLAEAARHAEAVAPDLGVSFEAGDLYSLALPDASFDVVHTHQVLQHLSDPVSALAEMRRVLAPGGILAARDSNYAAFWWSPDDERLDRWLDLYHRVTASNGADADGGRHLVAWARAAGFEDVTYSSSTWTFATADERAWWGGLWADRTVRSDFARQALERSLATEEDLASIAEGFREWAASPEGTFVVPHGEIIARR